MLDIHQNVSFAMILSNTEENMQKHNHLDQLPIADLDSQQLADLKKAEEAMNESGESVYLIALKKQENNS